MTQYCFTTLFQMKVLNHFIFDQAMKTAEYKSKTLWGEPGLVIVKWNSS